MTDNLEDKIMKVSSPKWIGVLIILIALSIFLCIVFWKGGVYYGAFSTCQNTGLDLTKEENIYKCENVSSIKPLNVLVFNELGNKPAS